MSCHVLLFICIFPDISASNLPVTPCDFQKVINYESLSHFSCDLFLLCLSRLLEKQRTLDEKKTK